jgi:hypothetical protein
MVRVLGMLISSIVLVLAPSPSKEARFLMLTWEDDVEVHALRKRGWSISAIARHTGFDRKTIRYADVGITDLVPQ